MPVHGHVKTSGVRAAAALVACTLFACVAPAAGATGSAVPPLIPRELDSLERFPGTLLQFQPGPRPEAVRRIRAAGGERVSHALRLWHVSSARARRILPALAMSGALQDFEPDRPVAVAEGPLTGDPLAARASVARAGRR